MPYEPRRIPEPVTIWTEEEFNDVQTSKVSDLILTKPYTHFVLLLDVESAGSPTDIEFKVQFSPDGGDHWYNLQNDFWGDLRYSDAAADPGITEAMDGPCSGRLFRLIALATGTAAADTFIVSARLELYR